MADKLTLGEWEREEAMLRYRAKKADVQPRFNAKKCPLKEGQLRCCHSLSKKRDATGT